MNEEDQCIYIIGGWDEKETLKTVFRYDTQTNKTFYDGSLPEQAEGHACVYIPEKQTVFIFGGFDSFSVTDRIMKYDLKAHCGSVVYGQKISIPRENHTAQLIQGDKIIVTNGWNGHGSMDDIDIFKYDSDQNTIRRYDIHSEPSLSSEDKIFIKNLTKL